MEYKKLSSILKFTGSLCLVLSLMSFLYSRNSNITKVSKSYVKKNPAKRKYIIHKNLERMLHINRGRASKFSVYEKARMVDIMYRLGERKYGINHKLMLAIIATESSFNRNAKNCNRRVKYKTYRWKGKRKRKRIVYCKSIDYGLGQQNSKFWRERIPAVKRINNKYKFVSKRKLKMSVYNIYANLIASINFTNYCLKYNRRHSVAARIECYNKGLYGARRTKNRRYYRKIIKNYNRMP